MTLVWFLADLKTGTVLEELPLKVSGLERTVSTKTTSQATLDIQDPSVPRNWSTLIDGTRQMVVPVLDEVPLGGFIFDGATVGDPTVPFTIASLEACAEYVFCRDHSFAEGADDEAAALATLMADVLAPSFGFQLVVTNTGKSGDHDYSFTEDRTIASAAADLTSQTGGPEWTTRVRWEDATHRRFIKTIEIGPRVGRLIPSTLFEDRHLQQRRRPRVWTNRAVHVIATGDGAGDSRPMSDPVVDTAALAAGVPQWEARVSASTVDDDEGLARVAAQALTRRRYGTQTWEATIAAVDNGAPRLGVDYDAGDIVTVDFRPTMNDPASWQGLGRVIGWRANLDERTVSSVTPVFWDPEED